MRPGRLASLWRERVAWLEDPGFRRPPPVGRRGGLKSRRIGAGRDVQPFQPVSSSWAHRSAVITTVVSAVRADLTISSLRGALVQVQACSVFVSNTSLQRRLCSRPLPRASRASPH